MTSIYPVILCGGSGTRLWPASRPDRPKQFLKLLGEHSSVQHTMLRVQDLAGARELIVVTGAAMAGLVAEQAAELGLSPTILIEPEARDSAPAVAAAAAYVQARDPDGVVLMLAADHHVGEPEAFRAAAVQAAEAAASGRIVTFGVTPTHPATGFGYIRPGAAISGDVHAVAAFVEKPDAPTAATYLQDGYLWNSGNFAFPASLLLSELQRFEPSIADAAVAAVARAERDGPVLRLDPAAFAGAAKISLDYAIMERTDKAAVVRATFTWSDLGAWDAIWDAAPRDAAGNAAHGDVALLSSSNVLIRSNGAYVGAIGVSDLMIVAEPDAVLICHRDNAQDVKALVDGLKAAKRSIAVRHAETAGPTGFAGAARKVLTVTPAARVELWTVEAGADLTLPQGEIRLIDGALNSMGQRQEPGAALTAGAEATTLTATSLLVTHWS